MKNFSRLTLFFVVLSLTGCKAETDISQKVFSDILEEMYMADQYIDYDSGLSSIADETFVYAPIIEKYGYTQEQFIASLDYYRHNPDILLAILKDVKSSIDGRFEASREAAQVFDFRDSGDDGIDALEDDIDTSEPQAIEDAFEKTYTGRKKTFAGKEKAERQDEVVLEENVTGDEASKPEKSEHRKGTERKMSKKELKELKKKWD